MIQTVLFIILILVLTSIIPVIFFEENRKDISRFLSLLSENFHLNNASVFIGYTVFDFNVFFLIMYLYSFVIYLIEHFFVIEDKKKGLGVKIAQIIVAIIGIIGQIGCAYVIISENSG